MILRYEQGHNPETHRWFGYQRSTFLDSQMLDDTKPLKYLLVKVRGSQLARLAEADFLATGRINLPTTNMQFTSSKTHRPKVHPSRKGLSLTMFDLWVPVWFLLHSPDASSLGWPPWSDKLPTSGLGKLEGTDMIAIRIGEIPLADRHGQGWATGCGHVWKHGLVSFSLNGFHVCQECESPKFPFTTYHSRSLSLLWRLTSLGGPKKWEKRDRHHTVKPLPKNSLLPKLQRSVITVPIKLLSN